MTVPAPRFAMFKRRKGKKRLQMSNHRNTSMKRVVRSMDKEFQKK